MRIIDCDSFAKDFAEHAEWIRDNGKPILVTCDDPSSNAVAIGYADYMEMIEALDSLSR